MVSVECGISYRHQTMLIHPNPRTGLEGKFSLEFCVALALSDRVVRLDRFTDSKVREPQIQELIKRVKKHVTREAGGKGLQPSGGTIEVALKNGKKYSYRVENQKRSPDNPLTAVEVKDKFLDCACGVHSKYKAQKIADALLTMENLDNIGELIKLVII